MIVSVDPGLTGGIANLSSEDGLWLEPMPRNENGIDAQELCRLVKEMRGAKAAYVESIYAVPSSGAHSMMVFGKTYGVVIGILTAFDIPIIEVRPQTWMKEIYHGCPESLVKKERSVWAFKKIFPGINANAPGKKSVHMGMLEAALIAEYGRRQ
jgi:hypothetical protein